MSYSKCPKCERSSFGVSTEEPSGSNFKLLFVKCSSCGTVVGTMDYFNIGSLIEKQNVAIKQIARKIGVTVDL